MASRPKDRRQASSNLEDSGQDPNSGAQKEPVKVPVFTGGFQRENLEPVTVLPGRERAFATDISAILDEFETALAASSSQTFPRTGAFPIFRRLFDEMNFSMVIEKGKGERPRDVFQLACGVCWRTLCGTQKIERRAGVLFLVQLLWHTQHPVKFAVPTNVTVMNALVTLREECLRRQVFLECPELLRRLVDGGVFSVGILATCRNLYFDHTGRVGERFSEEKDMDDKTGVAAVLRTQRLGIARPGAETISPVPLRSASEAASSMVPLAASVAAAAELVYDGKEVFELGDTIKMAENYDTRLDASGTAVGAASSTGVFAGLDQAVGMYQRDRPPEPRQPTLVQVDTSSSGAVPGPRKYVRRKRRMVADSDSGDDSGDKIVVTAEDKKRLRGCRTKYQRQSHLVGLEEAIRRQVRNQQEAAAAATNAAASSSAGVASSAAASSSAPASTASASAVPGGSNKLAMGEQSDSSDISMDDDGGAEATQTSAAGARRGAKKSWCADDAASEGEDMYGDSDDQYDLPAETTELGDDREPQYPLTAEMTDMFGDSD